MPNFLACHGHIIGWRIAFYPGQTRLNSPLLRRYDHALDAAKHSIAGRASFANACKLSREIKHLNFIRVSKTPLLPSPSTKRCNNASTERLSLKGIKSSPKKTGFLFILSSPTAEQPSTLQQRFPSHPPSDSHVPSLPGSQPPDSTDV